MSDKSQWMQRANCRGQTARMFPEQTYRDAVTVCHGCPVRRECAEAGQSEAWGVWGGVGKVRNRHRSKRLVGL